MLIVNNNFRNIYVVDIYVESTWQNVILLWQLWHLWLRQHSHSYQLWVQMSPLPHCLLINTCPHTAAQPHRCDDPWNRPDIKSLSVNIATEEDTVNNNKDLHTLIWFLGCGWMWAAWLLFTSHQQPCCRLHSPHPTFRILRGHSQGSAHCTSHRHVVTWVIMLLFSGVF